MVGNMPSRQKKQKKKKGLAHNPSTPSGPLSGTPRGGIRRGPGAHARCPLTDSAPSHEGDFQAAYARPSWKEPATPPSGDAEGRPTHATASFKPPAIRGRGPVR